MGMNDHLYSHMPVDTPIEIYSYTPANLKEGIPAETGGSVSEEIVFIEQLNTVPTE